MLFAGVKPYIRSMWYIFLKPRIDRFALVRFLFASSVDEAVRVSQQALSDIQQKSQ
jgi:hypothetical protein